MPGRRSFHSGQRIEVKEIDCQIMAIEVGATYRFELTNDVPELHLTAFPHDHDTLVIEVKRTKDIDYYIVDWHVESWMGEYNHHTKYLIDKTSLKRLLIRANVLKV